MALGQRRPQGVVHHSDQGTQYTSIAFGQRCREAGVRPSMGSVGDCFDNALCESLFASPRTRRAAGRVLPHDHLDCLRQLSLEGRPGPEPLTFSN